MPTPPENSVTSQIWGWMKVDCGPTIGWVNRPMFNDTIITSGTTYTVQPFDFQILVSVNADFTVTLPDVTTWKRQPYGLFPLFVKDVGGFATVHNITVTPAGSDTIDGLSGTSVAIASAYGSLSVRPRFGSTDWVLAP
jgi:hypothetical protein